MKVLKFSRNVSLLSRSVHVMPHIPRHFKEERMGLLHQLIRDYPLGQMVIQNGEGEYVPSEVQFHLKVDDMLGTLYGQVHLNNALHYLFEKGTRKGSRTIVTFSGPSAYISPSWHTEDMDVKMPGWNYAKVFVHGVPKLIKDPEITTPLLETLHNGDPEWNRDMMNKKKWTYATEKMMWFSIPIEKIYGNFKLSQDVGVQNIQSIIKALETKNPEMSAFMLKYYKTFVEEASEKKDQKKEEDEIVQDWEVPNERY